MKGLLLSYALVVIGTFGSLKNPLIGLAVYILFAVLRPQALWGWAGGLDGLSLIVGVAMIAGWALHGFGSWRFARGRNVLVALAIFTIWLILSTLQANDPQVAADWFVSFLKILMPILIGVSLTNSDKTCRLIIWTIVLAQAYVGLEMNQSYFLQGFNRAALQGFAGMDNNAFGISLVATIGPAVALGLSARTWRERGLAFGATLLILHTTLLTFSRGALLGLIAVGATAFVIMPKRPKYLATMAVVVAIAFSLTGPELTARFNTTFAGADERDASAESRLDLWRDCLTVAASRPVFGVGPQNWPLVAQDFGWPAGKHAHSVWMQTAAELGFPGVLALLMFFVLTIRNLWPMVRGREAAYGSERSILATGVTMSLVGYIVSAQFVSLQGLEVPYYVAIVGVGLVKRSCTPMVDEKQRVAPAAMRRVAGPTHQRPALRPAPQMMTRLR
jgi:probable O-glycosylation ligase (exosortase A-associated)